MNSSIKTCGKTCQWRLIVLAVFGFTVIAESIFNIGCGDENEGDDSDCEAYWTCKICTASGPAGVYTMPSTYKLDCDMSQEDVAQYMEDDCTERVQEMDPAASCSCVADSCYMGEEVS